MAIALRRIRDRIRIRIRETDPKNNSFVTPEIDTAIADSYLTLQARLPSADLHTSSAFTIGAGTDLFALPATVTQYTGNDGGAEYAGAFRIQLVSTGEFLTRVTVEELDSYRWGNQTLHLAIPEMFTLWEEKDQDAIGRCYPGAQASQACNLFARLSADDLRDFVGSGTDDLDDVEVLFSRIAANALVLYVAADLLERMLDKDLEARRLNPRSAVTWRREAEALIYQEAARRHRMNTVGRVQRWVS